jgi:hypothetical protein
MMRITPMIDDLAVFIMVWGRPDKMWTTSTLRNHGYTGKIYYVADDLDEKLDGYKKRYKDDLIVFSKKDVAKWIDLGDNTGDLRSTLYAVNIIPKLAMERGIKYFFIFCDDYTYFSYKMDGTFKSINDAKIFNLDKVFGYLLEYYKSIPALSIAIAQSGDFIGGLDNGFDRRLGGRRKVMNTFLCSTERPFNFVGRMNEDITTSVNLGGKGGLFLTFANIEIHQQRTQSKDSGLTDLYLDYGTYVKSFFAVMYNPSCARISMMGLVHPRVHHRINWNNAVPCIISEKYRKASQVQESKNE